MSTEEHKKKRRDYMREYYHRTREKWLARLRADRAANPEKHRAWDRERYYRDQPKRLALSRKWGKENPEKLAKSRVKYREQNAEKRRAASAVNNAVRAGRILREPCVVCGSVESHGHHEDYTKHLDVVWLCPEHHGERHREIHAQNRDRSS